MGQRTINSAARFKNKRSYSSTDVYIGTLATARQITASTQKCPKEIKISFIYPILHTIIDILLGIYDAWSTQDRSEKVVHINSCLRSVLRIELTFRMLMEDNSLPSTHYAPIAEKLASIEEQFNLWRASILNGAKDKHTEPETPISEVETELFDSINSDN